MTIDAKLAEQFQKPDVGKTIYLYELDISSITGDTDDVYRFVEATVSGSTVEYNSIVYSPANVLLDGFETTGDGRPSRPTMSVANVGTGVGASIAGIVYTYNDLLGAILTRKVTLVKHLDTGTDPDTTAYFEDSWKVNRKTVQNKSTIEFELTSYIDVDNKYCPGRLMIREYCTHVYRTYDTVSGTFNYDNATCPWAGDTHSYYFNRLGGYEVSAANDVCGKRLSDCKLRFIEDTGDFYAQSTAPVGPSTGDMWIDTDDTPVVWQYWNGSAWTTARYNTLPTRAFPMLGKVRL